jgi:integrase
MALYTPLRRITAEDLSMYREERAKRGKAAVYINMEIGAIRRLLKRAKRWHLLAGDIPHLKEPHREARVLLFDEKLWLARIAASRSDWQIARLAMILALNTTMRGCEIRGLRWHDVDFIERTLTIRRSKTEAGERVIPLNADAWAAVLELRERALTWFMAIAGHVSPRMLAHYSDVRLDAKRRALAISNGMRPGVKTQTASQTSQNAPLPNPQVFEKNGGPGLT